MMVFLLLWALGLEDCHIQTFWLLPVDSCHTQLYGYRILSSKKGNQKKENGMSHHFTVVGGMSL